MWAVLSALPAMALAAFAREDVQLFELRNDIAQDLGEKVNFYSWLGVSKSASGKDIMKAFRKISRRLHPDRNPGKEATDRFARLNQVYKILRSPMRERYDHYLSKGFPKFDPTSGEWKFHRFRPNLVLTIIFIGLIVTFIDFLIKKAKVYSQRKRLTDIINVAQTEAGRSSPHGVITSPARVEIDRNEFVVHPSGDVYFQSVKVDPSVIEEPTWQDTVLVKLVNKFLHPQSLEAPVEGHVKEVDAIVVEQEKPTSTGSAKEEEKLKKGASRRRPAGARGKAKIF